MYVVICENGVVVGKTLKEVNKQMDSLIEESEFVRLGSDYVCYMTKQDIDFVQDKKRLSMIPIRNLYKKDNTSLILQIVTLLFVVLIMMTKT